MGGLTSTTVTINTGYAGLLQRGPVTEINDSLMSYRLTDSRVTRVRVRVSEYVDTSRWWLGGLEAM